MATALLYLLLTLSLLTACSGQCPMSGCDGLRSFSSAGAATASYCGQGSRVTEPQPRLLWSYERHRPSGAGCVTNGAGDDAILVCPMADGQNASVVAFAAVNGSVIWYISLASQSVLPLVSYNEQSILSDGRTLAWLARDGRSLAPPVQMYPVQGQLFDLTITLSTSIVTMLYRCGFIATYTVDGIPIAGLWLNGSVEGVKGTYVPLGDPVINDTRLYILTAFRASSTTGNDKHRRDRAKENVTHLRLYCINVAAALDHKFTLLWTHNVKVKGQIPYIYTKKTYCDILSRGAKDTPRSGGFRGSASEWTQPLSVLTMTGGRVLAVVRLVGVAGTNLSFNMSVRDLGTNYFVISSGYSEKLVTSISWSNTEREKNTNPPNKEHLLQNGLPRSNGDAGSTFWLSSCPPEGDTTVLEKLTEFVGPPDNASSLILPTILTTPVTLLQYLPANRTSGGGSGADLLVFGSAGNVSCEVRPDCCGDKLCVSLNQPQLVGVVGEGGRGEGKGEGGEGEGEREREKGGAISIVWSVPLPRSQPAHGQISTLLISSDIHLFLTTPLGVYAYTIT